MHTEATSEIVNATASGDLAAILGDIGEAVVYVDAGWTVRYCNDVYLRNVGLPSREVIGRTPFDYVPGFRRSIFYEAIENCRQTRMPMLRIGFSTVLNRWLMVRVFPLGKGMVMLANDASEQMVKQHQLAQRVVLDPLTGLGNKLAMEQVVSLAVHRGQPFSILLVGIDRFKDVNDSHGYAFGDMVLLELASTLQSSTEGGETLYRLSGDEFAVLRLAESNGNSERCVALLQATNQPIHHGGVRVVLSACAGAVMAPKDGLEFELLLKRGRLALREAKKMGRDSVASYKQELEMASKLRGQIEGELRAALDGSQFTLLIQPKVSLTTGGVIGGEALIRWAHPKRGLLAPGAFLGIAEEIGVMLTIDQWVLRATLKIIQALKSKGQIIPISINLSVESLSDRYIVDRVSDALRDANVEPRLLEVEIPEGALMHDVKASGQILSALHAMGVMISIDDFGTGYSSFAYLAQFPVNALKIDRAFVNELMTSETSQKIVKSIVRLAHTLSLDVVAEGVEEDGQLAILRRMKCDSVQGFLLSKPLPLKQFMEFVAESPGIRVPDAMTI